MGSSRGSGHRDDGPGRRRGRRPVPRPRRQRRDPVARHAGDIPGAPSPIFFKTPIARCRRPSVSAGLDYAGIGPRIRFKRSTAGSDTPRIRQTGPGRDSRAHARWKDHSGAGNHPTPAWALEHAGELQGKHVLINLSGAATRTWESLNKTANVIRREV